MTISPRRALRDWIVAKITSGVCEITGIEFDLSKPNGRARPFSPSLDRLHSEKGYTKDNVRVVCWIYNAAKGSWTHDDVVKLAKAVS